MAHISIIIVSHNKPDCVKEAVQSVLDQTHQDWEAVLIDSGVLLEQGFFNYITDKRIRIEASGETPGMNNTVNMASRCFNQALNSGKLKGELVMYLCDDDLLYKNAFETFWKFYMEHNREPQAMYASQHVGLVGTDGKVQIIGKRIANRPAGKFCKGRKLDCQVDYLQFCHSWAILDRLREVYKTTDHHPEAKDDSFHADGVFMEKVGALTKVYNINEFVSMNRRMAGSSNLEYSASAIGRFFILIKQKFKGLRRRMVQRRGQA